MKTLFEIIIHEYGHLLTTPKVPILVRLYKLDESQMKSTSSDTL